MAHSEPVDTPTPLPSIFRLAQPEPADVEAMLARLGPTGFSYPLVGATREETLPEGWYVDAAEGVVGEGAQAAARAEAALRSWAMFDLGWVIPHRRDVPQQPGELMAFTARTYGVWSINVCRVVYRLEQDDGVVRRVGFAYGTLPGHALSGEERFELTWDRQSDSVVFAIRKFSRPNQLIVKMGAPMIRVIQRRFSEEAIARVAREARGE